MAPKRQQPSMKRPAAVVGRRTVKKTAITKPARGRQASKSRAIVAALKDVEGVSATLLGQLKKLLTNGAGIQQDSAQATLAELKQLLTVAEDNLLATLQRSQAVVDGAEHDRLTRLQAEIQAQQAYLNAKQAFADGKAVVKSSRDVATAQQVLERLQSSHKHEEDELIARRSQQHELACAERTLYAPLKIAPVKGAKGQKQLKNLCKVGKEHGFHDVLLSSLPAILTKQLDKRRTFDDFAIRQLDKEFDQLKSRIDADVQCKEASVASKSAALRAAQEAVAVAEEKEQASARHVTETEQALEESKTALLDARKRVRAFKSDARQSERDLKSVRMELSSFRKTALAAFGELQKRFTPAPGEELIAADTAVAEASRFSSSSDKPMVQWPATAILLSQLKPAPAAEQVTTADSGVAEPSMAAVCSPSSPAEPSVTLPATTFEALPSPANQDGVREHSISEAPTLSLTSVS